MIRYVYFHCLFSRLPVCFAGEIHRRHALRTAFDCRVNCVSSLLIRFMLVMVPIVLLVNGFSKVLLLVCWLY
ncbi:hypothetical protein LC76_19295 [Salmonella enterica]|nr:hypothetical protein [Salmonella enterica]EBM9478503.1 hypothetical protein [Salmonella enterica subsp. enterica serovar Rubislaw]ECT6468318.1 hypothetical protein [Salmonella enterica subsp. enterica serovar Senegal]EBO3245322.1 hypothetical protein [Salmonella enterica subsp. enterica serovar Rubislaw]EBT5148859.1 hypothetical protein [Salmonella enterica]